MSQQPRRQACRNTSVTALECDVLTEGYAKKMLLPSSPTPWQRRLMMKKYPQAFADLGGVTRKERPDPAYLGDFVQKEVKPLDADLKACATANKRTIIERPASSPAFWWGFQNLKIAQNLQPTSRRIAGMADGLAFGAFVVTSLL